MDSFQLVTVVRRLHHAIRAHVAAELRTRGYDDITPAHIYVFQTPGPDGLRPKELAERTLMTKQAMNHLLTGLEEHGYIERVAADGDRRARVLRLTDKGRRLTQIIQDCAAQIEDRWEQALGAEQMRKLLGALRQLDAVGTGPTTAQRGSALSVGTGSASAAGVR
jgi:DNA-binding MarR family transcriptional regulator